MPEFAPREPLQAFQDRAFARHMLIDLPFPVVGTFVVVLVCTWLLQGRSSVVQIALWALGTIATICLRAVVEQRMRRQVNSEGGHALLLRQFAWLSVPTGAISGAFACLYFDAQDPTTMVVLATYMTVVVVGAVVPTSVYLPAFYLLVLPAHLPYLYLLSFYGREEHFILVGLDVLFLMVTTQYARAAHQMHCESVRLRYENQQLIEDLGERRAAAESASHTKSLFLAGVSHDLKQPIRAMGLYLGVLQHADRQTRAAALDNVTPKMEKALSELHGQVTRLLALSRLESGALQLQMERVVLPALFADLHALFDSQARSKGIHLHFAQTGALHTSAVWADRKMLESILQNLISNAIKHTSAGAVYIGSRVRLGYGPGRQLCLEVRDSGSGIPLAQQAYLFDAYRSFDDRLASESLGLGLALAKAQATYLGCDIGVRSQPGCGSTFTLGGLQICYE